MLKCDRCNSRMFLDRQYSTISHLETYCITCGSRNFFHPPQESLEGKWLLKKEVLRMKTTMSSL
jgi:hypothetical protein